MSDSTSAKGRILVVDDEADIRESLEALLEMEGYSVTLASDGAEGLRNLNKARFDVVLLDLMLPDRSGMDVLADIRAKDQETPIIMLTAYGSVEVAVNAIKAGANDYFSKPWDNEKLLIEIETMIAKSRLESENTQLKRALKQRYSFPNIVGKSERMLRVLDLVSQVAPSRATILLTGETGTGKEVIAKAIHSQLASRGTSFCGRQQRVVATGIAGIDTLRACQRRVHERVCFAERVLRDCRRWHDLLR